MKLKYFFALFLVVFFLPNAYAYDPITHSFICHDQVMNSPELDGSRIGSIIRANPQCYDLGYETADISVIYYATCFKNYDSTHNWAIVDELLNSADTPCRQAIAYGWACHNLGDSFSHNSLVPRTIRQTFLPNLPIHPIKEASLASWMVKNEPQSFAIARTSMDYMDTLQGQKDIEWIQSKMNSFRSGQELSACEKGLDIKRDATTLKNALASPSGFFSQVFKLEGIYEMYAYGNILVGAFMLLIVFALYKVSGKIKNSKRKTIAKAVPLFFSYFLMVILFILAIPLLTGGLTTLIPIDDADKADIKNTIDTIKFVFTDQGWGTRYQYDPTGFQSWTKANNETRWVRWIALIVVLGILYWGFRRSRKGKGSFKLFKKRR